MNALAVELNRSLEGSIIGALLSEFGRRFYFPKGIVAQSVEAKKHAHRINATIGIATQGGQPLHLPLIKEHIPRLSPNEIFAYAPTGGLPRLRELWKAEMYAKNPALGGKNFSLPVVVSGLTHGISVAADLFADPGDQVILPDLFWGNYRLIFEGRIRAGLQTFPFFNGQGGINVEGLKDLLESQSRKKVIILLNFPNNPTGYSPKGFEAEALLRVLEEQARQGVKVLVITDDAYFGLFFEKDIYPQSLFAELASLHENILAVKVDGATKENLVWGFRIGFLTFAAKGLKEEQYQALLQKTTGAVRSSVSNSNLLAQNLLARALEGRDYARQKGEVYQLLKKRYQLVREFLKDRDSRLKALPFNSGYFMTLFREGGGTELLRRKLLMEHGIGTISIQDRYLRVAYSSVDEADLAGLFTTILQTAESLE